MKLLITGGAGFIGSNFIRYWIEKYTKDKLLNLDILTHVGNPENLRDIVTRFPKRYSFVAGDIRDFKLVDSLLKKFKPDVIVNFAAQSHNSYAILNPTIFFETNVLGTQTLLEGARKNKIKRFHHISTCEVYGDLSLDSEERFTEISPLRPKTPYNASKAGADLAVRAYFETFHMPVTTSNCCNNYGPYQFPEKLIPLFVTNLLDHQQVSVYKTSQNKREWIHVLDHCRAVDVVIKRGKIGEVYNVGTGVEKSIEEISDIIFSYLHKSKTLKRYVADRPGHDRRYLLDSSKIKRELDWQSKIDFDTGIKETIEWYVQNRYWWEPLKKRLKVEEKQWK